MQVLGVMSDYLQKVMTTCVDKSESFKKSRIKYVFNRYIL